MLKQAVITFLISIAFVITFQGTYACGSEVDFEKIAPFLYENDDSTISRGMCIMSLMKILGVDDTTADFYASADTCRQVFSDLEHDDPYCGYIIVAKSSGVAVGIQKDEYDDIHAFESERNVTVKECLAFMLRCLTDCKLISWDNVMDESVKAGLLQYTELDSCHANEFIKNEQFYTLLSRMLNKNRYLYWPTDEPAYGGSKSMQFDFTDSIKYADWLKTVLNNRRSETDK